MRTFLLPTTLLLVAAAAAAGAEPKPAASRVTAVTVYQNTALVTREVVVPEGAGTVELLVTPMPGTTVQSSLYSEGTDGIRVMTTRFRSRVVREDTREEARKLEAQIKELAQAAEKIQADIKVIDANLASLTKLEGFTSATLSSLTEKGKLDSNEALTLMKYVMTERAEKSKALVELKQKLAANQEQSQFARRQLESLSGRGGRTEHDAVIVADKKNAPEGKLRLNYLVESAAWRPQYKLRAGKDKDPVTLEYLAAVVQDTGEDWTGAVVTLSTAQPMLNAAPPDMKVLELTVNRGPADPSNPIPAIANPGYRDRAGVRRGQAQEALNKGDAFAGGKAFNDAAAEEQAGELLCLMDDYRGAPMIGGEGPAVTYRLDGKLDIPSRNDEQMVEIAKIEMTPDFHYKAVPVLTRHVYRLANLVNRSKIVLLAGEANMYLGSDFVGRMRLPVVAVGEQFTVGFGAEPQLQVVRRLVDKSRVIQGGNQVLGYDYEIHISSYKSEPVKLQLWDRLPTAEAQAVAVTLVSQKPELSKDPLYLREERPKNMLRWDLTIEPNSNGEKAVSVSYKFKLEFERAAHIGNVVTK